MSSLLNHRIRRPATDVEMGVLKQGSRCKMLSTKDTWIALVITGGLSAAGGGGAGIALAVFLHFFSRSFSFIPSPNALSMIAAGAAVGILIAVIYTLSIRRKHQTGQGQDWLRDMAAGEVEVAQFLATRAARCAPFEYLGEMPPAFFIELDDHHLLFLQGEYLRPAVRRKEFPCTEFEITYGVHSQTAVTILGKGHILKHTKIAVDLIYDEECYHPKDGEIIVATLDTVADNLKQLQSRFRKRVPAP
jgi:hypothetical protein